MSDDPRTGTILDGYRIEEKLGEGGMGVVYRAHHLKLGRDVAMKFVRPELAHDAAFRQRFDREIQLAASIQHAHLVTVHDAGETSAGDVYLTMQLVEGRDLQSMLDDSQSLRPARAARIVTQIARAWTSPIPTASSTATSSRATSSSASTKGASMRTSRTSASPSA